MSTGVSAKASGEGVPRFRSICGIVAAFLIWGAGAWAEDCLVTADSRLSYDVNESETELRDPPLLTLTTSGALSLRPSYEDAQLVHLDLPPQDAREVMLAADEVLRQWQDHRAQTQGEAEAAPFMVADARISHIVLTAPTCQRAASVAGLAFRAQAEPEDAAVQALRGLEQRLLRLLAQGQS